MLLKKENRHKIDTKETLKRFKMDSKDSKMNSTGLKIDTKWTQKRLKNGLKKDLKWTLKDSQNGLKMVKKVDPKNGPKMDSNEQN